MKVKTARKRGRPALPSPVASAASAEDYLKRTRPDETERRILLDVALHAKQDSDVSELERITVRAKGKAIRAAKQAQTAVHRALEAWGREYAMRDQFDQLDEKTSWIEKDQLARLIDMVNGLWNIAREFEEAVTMQKKSDQISSPKTRNPFTQTREMRMTDQLVRYALNLGFRVPLARELAALAVLVGAEDPKPGFDAGLKRINAWEWRLRELRKNPEFSEAMRRANSAEKPRARRT